jgi:hypothetical protein
LDFVGDVHPLFTKGHRFILIATDYFTEWVETTTEKCHLFVVVFKLVGTNEYIQIIFIGLKTDEYKLTFVGFDWETDEYMGAQA